VLEGPNTERENERQATDRCLDGEADDKEKEARIGFVETEGDGWLRAARWVVRKKLRNRFS
jgi:hypothetical protein